MPSMDHYSLKVVWLLTPCLSNLFLLFVQSNHFFNPNFPVQTLILSSSFLPINFFPFYSHEWFVFEYENWILVNYLHFVCVCVCVVLVFGLVTSIVINCIAYVKCDPMWTIRPASDSKRVKVFRILSFLIHFMTFPESISNPHTFRIIKITGFISGTGFHPFNSK